MTAYPHRRGDLVVTDIAPGMSQQCEIFALIYYKHEHFYVLLYHAGDLAEPTFVVRRQSQLKLVEH